MNSSYFDNKELFTGPKTSQYGSHMVMTNVAKETKVKHINIDTKFRDEYNANTTTNYNITLPQKVNEVKNMSVTNVELPMTFYNISENLGNNSMKITTGIYEFILKIPDGQYTRASLAITLQDIIDDATTPSLSPNSVITIAIPVTTNKTEITTSTSTPFTIEFDVDSTGNFAKCNFKFRLGWLLGFRKQSYTLTSTKSMTSECLVDLSGPRYLYLVVDEFTGAGNQNSFLSTSKNVLARIPISLNLFPFMSVYPFHRTNGLLSDIRSYTGKVDIQKLNVQLVNENGIVMDLNGADFSFCLRIEHE